MDIQSVALALQRDFSNIPRAVRVLFNYSNPISEREAAQLAIFSAQQNETEHHAVKVPDEIESLMQRPLHRLRAVAVVQCILGAAKVPSFPKRYQRQLQQQLLHCVTKGSSLSMEEWSHVLHYTASLPMSYSASALRCAEEMLKAAVPVLFDKLNAPASGEKLQTLFLSIFASVVSHYATCHGTRSKYPSLLLSLDISQVEKHFLASTPVRRLRRIIDDAHLGLEEDAWNAVIQTLNTTETFTLFVVAPWSCRITKEMVLHVVKNTPALIFRLLGSRPNPGSLQVESPDDVIHACVYNMGLATCGYSHARDFLAVVMAIPEEKKAAYFRTHEEDGFLQLLMPFVSNTKTLTPAVAEEWKDIYAILFLQTGADGGLMASFLNVASHLVVNKCRTASEKASIMILTTAVLSAVSDDLRSEVSVDSLVRMIERELSSPSTEAASAAWKLLRVSGVEGDVAEEMRSALRSAKSNEQLRRSMLLYMSPERAPADVIAGLSEPLLENCMGMEVCRPDAFLALRFAVKRRCAALPKLCAVLCHADVLQQLGENADTLDVLANVAVALANVSQFAPMALLLTHRNGLLRRRLAHQVATLSNDVSAVLALWDSVTRVVFGLEAKEKPKILSHSAIDALISTASALLQHTAKTAVSTALLELVLCCGHDHIQGEDHYYFQHNAELLGRQRTNSRVVKREVFRRLFSGDQRHLLTMHCETLSEKLCECFTGPTHLRISASRGLVLLLNHLVSVVPSKKVIEKLLDTTKKSVDHMMSLDARDRAIAASSTSALQEYEEITLRERQLLKTYPPKPPKGMLEDDYEDMKRRDAVALAKGREVLRQEIEKHRQAIEDSLQYHKTALVTIRTLGTSGHFFLEAVEVLYPYLQDALSRSNVPEVLERHLVDAITGLLSHTAFAYIAENMARTVSRLQKKKDSLTVADVSQISTMALHLRKAITQMLPAPLFVVLLPFSRVAFRAGRGGNAIHTTIPLATQHQIMGVLIQNLGQINLPQPTETLQLLNTVLQSFPSLFKTVQQGINLLMAMIPSSHLPALELGLFNQADAVKEVTAAAYHRFSHFGTCRRALVLAAISLHDTSADVVKSMHLVVKDPAYAFSLNPRDWNDLIYYLQTYGQQQKTHAARIGETMRELFLFSSTTEAQQCLWVEDICKVGGFGAVVALEVLSPSLKGGAFHDLLLFLCNVVESPSTEPYMRIVLSCGRTVLNDCILAVLKAMAGKLQERLSKPPRDITAEHKELYLSISTVWLTIISCRLKETALLESIIDQQSSTLNNSNSAMVHRAVCDSMVEITKNEDVRMSPKLDDFVEKCLKQTIHSGSYIKKKAHAYGLVGVLHGLGLNSLRRYGIMKTMQTAVKEKQAERSGVMVLLEVMSEVMGAKFEPYALAMCSGLLEGVADKDQKVSECADDASRVVVRSLTAVGLRQLIPRLVDGLLVEQAKLRVPPLNFIGYVAFCSPKQLAATLPEITKHINACLFDVNHNVSAAAMSALRRVAGVVSNAEIREHVEVILSALRSPNTETENALDALLYTRFVNAIDPASLALIIPILARGLSNQMPHTRPKAAQIVASMVNLVNDPKSLKPYCDELVSLLEEAAEDPKSESRTTSAKAIAALAAAIGGTMIDDIVAWCFTNLQKPNLTTVAKAGAAQVFVELVENCGDSILYDSFSTVQVGMLDERPPVREGFLHIMVYAPSTFSSVTFQRFLPVAFPWVLEGLSHFSDRVRDVALAAGSSIINLYGTRNLSLVLDPLLGGVVSEVTTLRQSSMLLASKLLIHVVQQIRKKMRLQVAKEGINEDGEKAEVPEQDLEADADMEAGGVLQVEAARDAEKRGISIIGSLESALGSENFIRLLSAIYCGRHEHNLNVRTDANNAWQACVASLRSAVKKIFDGLVDVLVLFGSSENPDSVEMAVRTIEFTSRLSEMIEPFITSFCDRYKNNDRQSKLGALICLSNIVGYVDSRRLISVGGQIVGCVLPGMQEKDTRVQQCAREVFAKVSKSVGPRLIEDAIEAQIETSVRGVVEVVKVKPSLALDIVFRYLERQPTYAQCNLELLDAILDVEEADAQMNVYVEHTGRTLLGFILQRLDGASDTYRKYVENIDRTSEHIPLEHWQKALRAPATQRGALLAAEAYGLGVSLHYVEGISAVFRAAIESFSSEDEEIRNIGVSMIPRLIASLEQRVVASLEEEEQQDLTTSKRAAGRYLLQYLDVFQETLGVTARAVVTEAEPEFAVLGDGEPTRIFDVLMALYNRGLDYGNFMQKVQSVECIQDLLTYAPRRVSAGAANTVAGRCSKVLFTRNEGAVVLAVVRLCLQLMGHPASGKEKMVEGTMALAMFNAALCDVGEARVLALRVVMHLLQRSEKYADLILGTVVTKKAAIDSPLLRGVMCRFISVVVRYGHLTKALSHITKLMDVVLPIWESAETPATAAAAGVGVAALCKSASVADEQVAALQEKALSMMQTRGNAALSGFAFAYALVTASLERTNVDFVRSAANSVREAASFGVTDKLTVSWILRTAAALANTGLLPAAEFRTEVFVPMLRRVDVNDEFMMSTAQYFYDVVVSKFPVAVSVIEEFPRERSTQWCVVGHFDADLDDEVAADTTL